MLPRKRLYVLCFGEISRSKWLCSYIRFLHSIFRQDFRVSFLKYLFWNIYCPLPTCTYYCPFIIPDISKISSMFVVAWLALFRFVIQLHKFPEKSDGFQIFHVCWYSRLKWNQLHLQSLWVPRNHPSRSDRQTRFVRNPKRVTHTRSALLHAHNFLSRCFRTSFSASTSHCVSARAFFPLAATLRALIKGRLRVPVTGYKEMTRMKAIGRCRSPFSDPRTSYDILHRDRPQKKKDPICTRRRYPTRTEVYSRYIGCNTMPRNY